MLISIFTDSHIAYQRFKTPSNLPLQALTEHISRSLPADITLHSGDLFDAKRVSPTDLRRVQLQFRRLPPLTPLFGPPGHLLACAGNHEDVEMLALIDAALPCAVVEGVLIPRFYAAGGEILVLYAVNYGQKFTRIADSKPFFDKNQHLLGVKRACLFMCHCDNNVSEKFDFGVINDFNKSAFQCIEYIVNGHEHESQEKIINNVVFIQPGTEIQTSIKSTVFSNEKHHYYIDTSRKSFSKVGIFSGQLVCKRVISFDCKGGKLALVEEFVMNEFKKLIGEIFAEQSDQFGGLDEEALKFGAEMSGIGVQEYRNTVIELLRKKDVAVYSQHYLNKPAVIVNFNILNYIGNELKSEKITTLVEKYKEMFENTHNYFSITVVKEVEKGMSVQEMKSQNGIEISYSGISVMKDFVQQRVGDLQKSDGKVGDIEESIDSVKKVLQKQIQAEIDKLIDQGDDIQDGVNQIISQYFQGGQQSQSQKTQKITQKVKQEN